MSLSRYFEKKYHDHPLLRSLLQLIPGGFGAAVDSAVSEQLHKMRTERLDTLFQELQEGERELTPELIQSEDFLQAFLATTNAALRTKRREKIRWFGRLLLAATGANPGISLADEHEDYLAILDDLSYREIGILAMLAEFEAANPKAAGENDLQWSSRFWDTFKQTVCEKFNIPPGELRGILARLNRSGCYETFAGGYLDYQGGQGILTPTYYRLAKLIRLQGFNFVP